MYCSVCGKQTEQTDLCTDCTAERKLEETADAYEFPNDQKLFLLVRSNAQYYLKAWTKKMSWNWAAFFAGPYWFGYRKMYLQVFLPFGLHFLLNLIWVKAAGIYNESNFFISAIPIAICLGLFANSLYYRHARMKIAEAEEDLPEGTNQLRQIENSGGTTGRGAMWALAIFMVHIFFMDYFFHN